MKSFKNKNQYMMASARVLREHVERARCLNLNVSSIFRKALEKAINPTSIRLDKKGKIIP